MDAFAFDQRFARYVRQVNSQAISRGTELFESEEVRVDALGRAEIRGSVTEGKRGVFQVRLAFDETGGLSGSCDCEEFFNCRHSYALARAVRVKLNERSGLVSSAKPAAKAPPTQTSDPFAQRLGRALDDEERSLSKELARLFGQASKCGFLVYPRDLYNVVSKRTDLGVATREPLRDLKRALAKVNPDTSVAFVDALKAFFTSKGIATRPAFDALAKEHAMSRAVESVSHSERSWDRPPVALKIGYECEPAEEGDWYRINAKFVSRDEGFTDEEIARLVAADGELTQLGSKGWFRVDPSSLSEYLGMAGAMGLDPRRGNKQRIHVTQFEDLLDERNVDEKTMEIVRRRARQLTKLEIPSPPRSLGTVLRPYQVEGFRFLCRLSLMGFGGVLADDMGLGKTLQTLAWFMWLARRKGASQTFRALVVCPKSVMDNWIQEPLKFGADLSSVSFSPALLGEEALGKANIVVANYAQLRLQSEYFLSQSWDVAALDEAHYIKSPSSQTTKVAYQLNAASRLALSGTPVENSLTDLWSLMRFAMPRLLGPQAAFKANYELAKNPEALAGLKRRVRPFILRRLKSEVAKDLPERIEEERHCVLEGAQRRLYDEELENARSTLESIRSEEDWQGQRFGMLQVLLRLRQICCDPRLIKEGGRSEGDAQSAKLSALRDVLEPLVAEGHKALVFSQFVSMLEILKKQLSSWGIGSLLLTGKTRNRKELVDRFQSQGGEQVFLLSLKAAGSGLNLTAASYVVLFDPWWNPAVEAQAIDRTHRIGQRNQVIAYRIVAKDTIEEKIREIQRGKADLANSVLGDDELSAAIGLQEMRELLR
ncbi:DEAD/DEAH box helicase [Pelagicoccus sp. SDUM812003]|uniref:DEAD/DEAH box helicase n=1 Tax=Pelagicoccus sp. SDUM812003 TaxID=3041267 RepID=UPI00280C485B|nr:DEAD/DEAH box helicase [Pelagicoccus sp. SDUM812003]MDQ8202034.1 DEAD/DEAH box helicase [Pelagicoccus sp. SDUM812003]